MTMLEKFKTAFNSRSEFLSKVSSLSTQCNAVSQLQEFIRTYGYWYAQFVHKTRPRVQCIL